MTLKSNEYQTYMLKFVSNVIQKLCDLVGGGGGGHQMITGGGHDRPKKGHIIVERSLAPLIPVKRIFQLNSV